MDYHTLFKCILKLAGKFIGSCSRLVGTNIFLVDVCVFCLILLSFSRFSNHVRVVADGQAKPDQLITNITPREDNRAWISCVIESAIPQRKGLESWWMYTTAITQSGKPKAKCTFKKKTEKQVDMDFPKRMVTIYIYILLLTYYYSKTLYTFI